MCCIEVSLDLRCQALASPLLVRIFKGKKGARVSPVRWAVAGSTEGSRARLPEVFPRGKGCVAPMPVQNLFDPLRGRCEKGGKGDRKREWGLPHF